MKKPMLTVTLNTGEKLVGTELIPNDKFFRDHGIPLQARAMFDGIWLLHSNLKKVSFLAHDTIISKVPMK